LAESVITRDGLSKTTLAINTGDSLDTNFIEEVLEDYGFERVDFVSAPGQYSQRGSIIDIYSYSNDEPYRIDFFGDTIDSIRTFDVVSQLSQERCKSITIIPDICNNDDAPKIPFLAFVAKDAVVWFQDKNKAVREAVHLSPTPDDFAKSVFAKKNIDAGFIQDDAQIGAVANSIRFNITTQPNFQKNFNLLAEDIASRQQQGYQTYIAVLNDRQNIRLHDIFASDAVSTKVTFKDVQMSINEGFIDKCF
jgi:transcription-repair coupling factor (superfamily II helicase)